MKNYEQIIVTGSIAYDEIMDFPGKFIDYLNKEKLHQLNVAFVVDRLERQFGGIATNISYNLSLISVKKVKILGAVGKDSGPILNFLKKNKVDIDDILVDKKLFTSTGTVITDRKDNQIWGYYYGASYRGQEINLKKFTDSKTLIIISANHRASFLSFQHQAIKLKLDYIFDPGMAISVLTKKELIGGIMNCRFLVGNDYEISAILKSINLSVRDLCEKGISVIVTLGEKGVDFFSNKESYHAAAFPVKKIVDPTGAGDAWRAGFISGIFDKRTIAESLKIGNALASFAIEKYGTVNHRPSRKAIESRTKLLKVKKLMLS